MATPEFILFPGDAAWRIAKVDGGGVAWFTVPGRDATNAVAAMREQGYAGRSVTLAVESDSGLAARIATDGLPRGDHRAMLYRFEEKLPLAAEQVAADFVTFAAPLAGGDGALGVCVLLDRVGPVVAGLEAAGAAVRSIVPAALAAAQQLTAHDGGDAVLILGEPPGPAAMVSVVTLRGGRPIDWALLPLAVADVKLHLDLLAADVGTMPRVVAVGLAGEWVDRLIDGLSQVIAEHEGPVADAAASRCADALRGGPPAWVELRRDALAAADRYRQIRRPLNAALGAAAVMLLALTIALVARSFRYARVEADSRAALATAFHDHFPGWTLPASPRAVIESEHRKAAATVAGPSGGGAGGAYGSAFAAFRDVLAGLPEGGGFTLERVSVQDTSLELAGRLQALEQVDAMTAAARRSGMDVSPPQTRRDTGGAWTFVLQGTRPTSARPAAPVASAEAAR